MPQTLLLQKYAILSCSAIATKQYIMVIEDDKTFFYFTE